MKGGRQSRHPMASIEREWLTTWPPPDRGVDANGNLGCRFWMPRTSPHRGGSVRVRGARGHPGTSQAADLGNQRQRRLWAAPQGHAEAHAA